MSNASARKRRPLLLGLLALVGGAALYCHHLGYPAGPLYVELPATEKPSPDERDMVAVFFSGDMGFNTGMGPRIAARIAAQGIPVLGVNSLTAFAHRRSPGQTVALVQDAMTHALAWKGARRVLLIGQSFGADALLNGTRNLPPALRARIAMAVLVVPQDTLSSRATPGGVLSFGNDGPSLPAGRQLDWVPVLCIHGESEQGSLCPIWRQVNVRRVALPGGHFLHEDSPLVAATILRAFATQS